jgi:hypothetical protein
MKNRINIKKYMVKTLVRIHISFLRLSGGLVRINHIHLLLMLEATHTQMDRSGECSQGQQATKGALLGRCFCCCETNSRTETEEVGVVEQKQGKRRKVRSCGLSHGDADT